MTYVDLNKQIHFHSRELILLGSILYARDAGNYILTSVQTRKNELILFDSYSRYRYRYLEHSTRWIWTRVIPLSSFILGNTKFSLILYEQKNDNKQKKISPKEKKETYFIYKERIYFYRKESVLCCFSCILFLFFF